LKNSKAIDVLVSMAVVIVIGAMAGRTGNAAGPSPVNLGTAANFSVLAGSAVTNTGPTTTDRDVGVWAGTSIGGFTGPPNGTAGGGGTHPGDPTAQQAQSDLTAAYTVAANAPVTANYTALGGLRLVGGVYGSGGATQNLTGVLTLDGQNDPSSVWIFKASSDLVTATGSAVSYINGASPCNVFWQVTSSATLGTGSTFVGTIMALASVTVSDSVTIYGRALARTAAVTLINDRFLTTNCQSAPIFIPNTLPPFTPAPSVAPTTTPAATPTATASSSVGPTSAPTAAPVAAVPTATPAPAAIAGTQGLPSTSTDDPSGPLTMLGLALTGIGIVLLRGRPIRDV
jgi:hypothetical protein